MDILIESTRQFEKDMSNLTNKERLYVVNQINDYVNSFSEHKKVLYQKLRRIPLNIPNLDKYDSSLYTMRIGKDLRIIITIDEDPIFEQIIFTLFRVVKFKDLRKAYLGIAESLYQDLKRENKELLSVS